MAGITSEPFDRIASASSPFGAGPSGRGMTDATRTVMLTSHGRLLSPAELKKFGIASCLIKPVKQSCLLGCLTDSTNWAITAPTSPPKTVGSTSTALPLKFSPVMEKMRLLLAEDNIVNQKLLWPSYTILAIRRRWQPWNRFPTTLS